MKKRLSLQRIIDRLVKQARIDSVVSTNTRKPGYYIEHLSEEDREILKEAKGKNFQGRMD